MYPQIYSFYLFVPNDVNVTLHTYHCPFETQDAKQCLHSCLRQSGVGRKTTLTDRRLWLWLPFFRVKLPPSSDKRSSRKILVVSCMMGAQNNCVMVSSQQSGSWLVLQCRNEPMKKSGCQVSQRSICCGLDESLFLIWFHDALCLLDSLQRTKESLTSDVWLWACKLYPSMCSVKENTLESFLWWCLNLSSFFPPAFQLWSRPSLTRC